jgi:hypothetical protein
MNIFLEIDFFWIFLSIIYILLYTDVIVKFNIYNILEFMLYIIIVVIAIILYLLFNIILWSQK